MNKELKAIIEAEIELKVKDIGYKIAQDLPLQFITPIQHEIFTLQWVLARIEKFENDEIYRENTKNSKPE